MTPAASLLEVLEAPVRCSSVNEIQEHTSLDLFEVHTLVTPPTAFWEEAAEYAATPLVSSINT
jgi:hypothetical protein